MRGVSALTRNIANFQVSPLQNFENTSNSLRHTSLVALQGKPYVSHFSEAIGPDSAQIQRKSNKQSLTLLLLLCTCSLHESVITHPNTNIQVVKIVTLPTFITSACHCTRYSATVFPWWVAATQIVPRASLVLRLAPQIPREKGHPNLQKPVLLLLPVYACTSPFFHQQTSPDLTFNCSSPLSLRYYFTLSVSASCPAPAPSCVPLSTMDCRR
jgi:hypothetical protein